ncbi:hypothetical protein GN958_ATG19072 [Phytophthora infestans]|uniref:Uncharacterized protein n=1 Tax=Phytophthora infestans TaxID=4787 RepID=A0A8S9TYJ2_PHYIN|nr:hypothetical protein GN958_ATG19072 [Phytophthora infestans]
MNPCFFHSGEFEVLVDQTGIFYMDKELYRRYLWWAENLNPSRSFKKMQRELHRRVRLTKQQQLELCRMHSLEPTWSLAILGRWADKQFALEKAPAKSSVKRIVESEAALKSIPVDFIGLKKAPTASMLALDS